MRKFFSDYGKMYLRASFGPQAVVLRPWCKQCCGARSPGYFGWLEPEPEPKIFR